MKRKKQDLQKLTDSEVKIKDLLCKTKIEEADLDSLNKEELKEFSVILTEKLNVLKGDEFDKFYSKIELVTPKDTKNQIWERNHNQITWAISVLMQDYGRMPTIMEIAEKTQFSRQTVHKHFKEYLNDPRFLEIVDQFKFMTSKVLARVFKFAVNGDMKAAKLYFDVIGPLGSNSIPTNITNTQNNYVQINQIKISQEIIKQLNPEQLNQIEAVLKNLLPVAN
jgi:hypothetical protein